MGVTTVPKRREDLLPRTLASLVRAGFDQPRLFIDGVEARDLISWERQFNLPVTSHHPALRTFGNWTLSLWELYVRDPNAERYAIFQDDFVTYPNLRRYLECCPYPERGYWNLYTFPSNQQLAPKTEHGGTKDGWYLSNQFGRGAVALVFNREAVVTLLGHPHMVERPQDCHRGWRAVDGAIVTAMAKAGWKEWVHSPSLVQHTGLISSMGNKVHLLAESFRGEDWDVMQLVNKQETA